MSPKNNLCVKDILQIDGSISVNTKFHKLKIQNMTLDSRKVEAGYLFGAFKGEALDGRKFIPSAIEKGAQIIVTHENYQEQLPDNVCLIEHENPRNIFALIASKLYKQPSNIVAVTGTNGKTSIASFCAQIWQNLGKDVATIGTLGVQDSKNLYAQKDYKANTLTTPETVELRQILANLQNNEINNIAIEASSHGIEQYRLEGLNVKAAAFSNFTQDHLDYHKTLENYFNAKARLFSEILPENSVAILNSDDNKFDEIYAICKKRNHKIYVIGKNPKTNNEDHFIKISNIDESDLSTNFDFEIEGNKYSVSSSLIGEFQIYNMLMAATLIYATTNNKENNLMNAIATSLNKLDNINGRMQKVLLAGDERKVFVDYAHTPDALQKSLIVLNEIKKARLIVVFGCGGNRDQSKRSVMGQIANEKADIVIITDDNPRFEDANKIRRDIMKATPKAIEVADREKAIKRAISMMQRDDILLIAGKGHENYQDIKGERHYFNDEDVVKKHLN